MDFQELLLRQRKWIPQVKVLGLDPGQTTGVAVFEGGILVEWSQLDTKDIPTGITNLYALIERVQPHYIIAEAYKVYSWKKDEHSWSSLHTPQLIGVIKTIAQLKNIPHEEKMAVDAKTFCDNDKLEMWGFYKPGMRHARDAIRHSCFSLLFSKNVLFTKP